MQERREMMNLGLRWSTIKATRLGIGRLYVSVYRCSSRAKSVVERSGKACGMWKFRKEGLFEGGSGNGTPDEWLQLAQEPTAMESGQESNRIRKESD